MAVNKTKTYTLDEIKTGDFICWEVCTQAVYASTTKLIDGASGTTYFQYNKPGTSNGAFRLLGQGSVDFRGQKLQLVITSEVDGDIKQTISSYGITDASGNRVGHGYNLCVEDSTDEDYNDIYVNIVGWNKKG